MTLLGALPSNAAIAMADLADATEYIQDTLNTTLVAGANVTLTYNDVANTLTIASAGGGGGGFIDTVADTGHPGTGTDIDLNVTGTTLTAKLLSSTTPQLERLGLGVAAGGTARLTLPATASLAGGIDFGGTASLQYVSAGKIKFERPSGGSSTFDINAATTQNSILSFSENGSAMWTLTQQASNDKLKVTDGTNDYVRFDRSALTVEFPLRATDLGAAGHVVFQLASASAWDVSSAGGNYYGTRAIATNGFAGGVNDRGVVSDDDVTATDAPNVTTGTATWWQPVNLNMTFASKGMIGGHVVQITQSKPTGATFPTSNYNEVRCFDGFVTLNNKGANCAIAEFGVTINNTGTTDAGPARGRGIVLSVTDQNLHAAYTSTEFGSGSRFIHQGSIGIDFQAAGAGYVGTGIAFNGGGASSESSAASAYRRAIVLRNRAGTMDLFCLDGTGNIGVRRSTNQVDGTTLSAALTVGWTSAGAESTVAADGIMWGDDVVLYRGNADVLVTDDQFNALRYLVQGTAGNGYINFTSQSSDPAAPADTAARLFARRKTGDATKMELCVRFETSTHVLVAET